MSSIQTKTHLKLLFTCLLLSLGAAPFSHADSSPSIKYVTPRVVQENTFKRICEFFDGQEHTGSTLIMRSHPETRRGYYLIVNLDAPASQLPGGGSIEVSLFKESVKEPITHTFALENALPRGREVWLGFTEAGLIREAEEITAWKVEIKDASGVLVTQKQSFLWSLPTE